MHSVMQIYSSFSFSCPAGMPQDCPARRVRICRPFRGKGPSACSKGKTGACVLNRPRRAEPPESPGPIRHIADSRPQNHAALSEKRRPAGTGALHSAHRLRSPAQRSRTRRPLSPREKTCVEARLPCFSPPPIRFAAQPTACTSPTAGRSAAILRADAPAAVLRQRPAPERLPEAKDKKKTMPKHRLFLFNTPGNRRKHQSP